MGKTLNQKSFTLYSYTIPYDDGAAPNPYWGKMTLAICKPVIRRTAKIGDWIVGTGSKNSPLGDIRNSIVYLMKVTKVLTMQEYDQYCKRYLLNKIPDIKNKDIRRHVGDCIYDFSNGGIPKLRQSVHGLGNRKTDLGGDNVLLSEHFYYFGDHPLFLPKEFQSILKPNQGHKSASNNDIADDFIKWFMQMQLKRNKIFGNPQKIINFNKIKDSTMPTECSKVRCRVHKLDEKESQ